MNSLLNRSLNEVRKSRDSFPGNGKALKDSSNDSWKHDMYLAQDQANTPGKPTQTFGRSPITDDVKSTHLLITNLHYDVSEAELEALFSQIGKIERGPLIKFDQSGRATEGLAFISYVNESHAEAAIKAFNGALAKGQPIGVQYELSMPKWVRKSLGINNPVQNRDFGPSSNSEPLGLLGRIQQDRSLRRSANSPYASDRPRGARASFPPGRVPPRGPSSAARPFGGAFESSGASSGSHKGSRGARGSRSSFSRPTAPGGRGKVLPIAAKSAKDLDKELEAFMKTTPAPKSTAPTNEDVAMSH